MKDETKAVITDAFTHILFYSVPIIATAIIFIFIKYPYSLNFEKREIEASLSSAWIGYSFAAAFFLIALPPNKYTQKLQEKGLLIRYALVIMSPAILGTLHLLSIIFTSQVATCSFFKTASAFLFYATVSYTLYSILLLLRILFLNAKQTKK